MTAAESSAPGLDPADFDDAARLLAADSAGRLRGAASAGALVRAVAAAVEEGALDRLRGGTVRSVVLVASRGPARRAAVLLQALVGEVSSVPVVHAGATPKWVGALDLVVIGTDDPGDAELAESVARAVGRGAEVVLAAPEEGLLTPAAAGRALLLPPRVQVPEGMGLLRFAAVGLSVLAVLGVCQTPDLAALADELDAEAERNQVGRDVFANPAKALALRCSGRRLVIAADSSASAVVGAHLASVLLEFAGVVAVAAELSQLLVAPSGSMLGAVDSLFYDPEIDGPPVTAPLRTVLLGTSTEIAHLGHRSAALSDAELVVGAIESGSLQGISGAELLLLVSRCETAAVYLGLAGRSEFD